MAKSKKDIDAFQKAMLTNTKIIGKKTKSTATPVSKATTSLTKPKAAPSASKTTEKQLSSKASDVSGKGISEDLYVQLESLSDKYGVGINEFIDASLRMALKLEDFWFAEDEESK